MRIPKARLQATGQALVSQQRVEVHRHFGNADAVVFGRDRGVQIGESLGVIEPGALGHEAFD